MLKSLNLGDTTLSKLLNTVEAGDVLYVQGDRGLTMFVIVEGQLELIQKTGKNERIVAVMGPGDVLGEKALISDAPFRRNLTARAKTTTSVLEFDATHFKVIMAKFPAFTTTILRVVLLRLDRANELIGILQLTDSAERLIQYLLYLARNFGDRKPHGVEISVSIEQLQDTLNLESEFLAECINHLSGAKVLVAHRDGFFISDENALATYLPLLRDRIAA